MNNSILLFIAFLSFLNSSAQFGSQQIISSEIGGARSVFASDMDGDGDLDVLSASRFDDKVSWFENIDGLGNFGEEQVIDDNLPSSSSVFAIDLDGDGDNDVVSEFSSTATGSVVWYENIDGLGDFSSQQIISNNLAGTVYVYATDLDGDGDNDVLSSSATDNKIAWYRNDGFGNFGNQQIITPNALSSRQVIASDIDGDGDMDVIYVSTADDKILWQENTDGLGNFGSQQIVSINVDGVISVFSQDIDGDNDMDIVSASFVGEIAWHENINGLGAFGEKQIISLDVDTPRFVYAADLDNDGDIDVLSASHGDDKIAWYENIDGLGGFGFQKTISTFPDIDAGTSVISCDIDNDGDMDVLSASLIDAKIAWYENLTILGIEDNSIEKSISLSPNPASHILIIENNSNYLINSVQIYDVLGRLLFEEIHPTNQIDVSNLTSGLLFVQLETDKGVIIKKVVKE